MKKTVESTLEDLDKRLTNLEKDFEEYEKAENFQMILQFVLSCAIIGICTFLILNS